MVKLREKSKSTSVHIVVVVLGLYAFYKLIKNAIPSQSFFFRTKLIREYCSIGELLSTDVTKPGIYVLASGLFSTPTNGLEGSYFHAFGIHGLIIFYLKSIIHPKEENICLTVWRPPLKNVLLKLPNIGRVPLWKLLILSGSICFTTCLQLWPPCRRAKAIRQNGGRIFGSVIFQTFLFQRQFPWITFLA